MADERRSPPYNQPSAVPAKCNWPTLLKKYGDDLFDHYRHMLESLGIILPQLQYQTPLGRYHTDSKKNVNVW
jgi:hypothetical protein